MRHCVFKLLMLFAMVCVSSCTINTVRDLLQRNLFGLPVLHKEASYVFDPEEGVRRSRQYQELNGRLGEKAIERLGLGIDGYDRERLAQQRSRDAGLLG